MNVVKRLGEAVAEPPSKRQGRQLRWNRSSKTRRLAVAKGPAGADAAAQEAQSHDLVRSGHDTRRVLRQALRNVPSNARFSSTSERFDRLADFAKSFRRADLFGLSAWRLSLSSLPSMMPVRRQPRQQARLICRPLNNRLPDCLKVFVELIQIAGRVDGGYRFQPHFLYLQLFKILGNVDATLQHPSRQVEFKPGFVSYLFGTEANLDIGAAHSKQRFHQSGPRAIHGIPAFCCH